MNKVKIELSIKQLELLAQWLDNETELPDGFVQEDGTVKTYDSVGREVVLSAEEYVRSRLNWLADSDHQLKGAMYILGPHNRED